MLIQAQTLTLLHATIPNLEAVYVFGSRATEQTMPNSDLDLAVLAKHSLSKQEWWELSNSISVIEHCDVDLIDLLRTTTVLQYQIVTTGQRIWARNSFATEYELFIYRNYEDLQIDRREIIEDILNRRSVYGRRNNK